MKKKPLILMITFLFFSTLLNNSCSKETEGKVIKIGAMIALTGDYAAWGKRSRNAIQLAVEEINNDRTNSYKLLVHYEDSPGIPRISVSVFKKLTEIDKIKFIIGPLSSAETLAIAPIAEEKKVLVITPVSSSPKITNAGDYIFRTCASDVFEGTVAAQYIYKKMNKKNVGIIYLNNDYGIGIKNTFSTKFLNLGGIILISESFNTGTSDFRTQLLKIKEIKPEVILLIGYAAEMVQILKQAKEISVNSLFFSFSPFESPEILNIATDAANGVTYVYQGFEIDSPNKIIKNFVEKYKKKFNEDPDIFAALSYDTVKIYAKAFDMAGNNVENVKKTLYSIKDYIGATGKITFDKNGDVIKPIGIKKVENKEFHWIEKEFEVETR